MFFLAGLLAWVALLPGQAGLAIAQTARPSWTYTGTLNRTRAGHTATLLPSGKVLIVGGYEAAGPLNTAELYDPSTGTWTSAGNLDTARAGHTATLLPNGKVLIVGGGYDYEINSTELYDPATGTWTSTGNLNVARGSHTATLLPDGKVLVAGGYNNDDFSVEEASAELYDPTTGKWSITGSLHTRRHGHTATLLPDGRVLVAGGAHYIFNPPANSVESLHSSELYDPNTGTWSVTGSLNTGRESHTATLLRNGNVLVAGGEECSVSGCGRPTVTISAELYNPGTGEWSGTASLNTPRTSHTATLLPDGRVLIAGGILWDDVGGFSPFDTLEIAEIYDPAVGNWSRTASLNVPRDGHTATLLSNGKVLVVGGYFGGYLSSAELYDSSSSSAPNPIDDSQFFVGRHYVDFLNREPDAAGLAFWTNEIASCGDDAQCVEVKRINVSAAYFLSIEFQETGYEVYRMYKAAYGNLPNAPVPIKFDEFRPDTRWIGRGVVVNQSGWQQALKSNKEDFAIGFVRRPRFVLAYPASLPPDQFVDQLFANAGVAPSATDRAAAVNEFGSAATAVDVRARARALRDVAENKTLAQQEFNRAFVLMQYFGYLRRNPDDAPDSNFDGYNFWLNKLNAFNGDFAQAEMVKAFITADEYRRRFGP